jgi:hypothetical protein
MGELRQALSLRDLLVYQKAKAVAKHLPVYASPRASIFQISLITDH